MSTYVSILILLFILSIILKSPKFKGFVGEKFVSYRLNKLDKKKYIVMHDITIPSV